MVHFRGLVQTLTLQQRAHVHAAGNVLSYLISVPHAVRTLLSFTDEGAEKERNATDTNVIVGIPKPGSVCWPCS